MARANSESGTGSPVRRARFIKAALQAARVARRAWQVGTRPQVAIEWAWPAAHTALRAHWNEDPDRQNLNYFQ